MMAVFLNVKQNEKIGGNFRERKIMELYEQKGNWDYLCTNCGFKTKKVVCVSIGNRLCGSCLIKSLLLIRPIQFDRLNVLESLDYLKRTADNGDNDLLRFIEWLKPFFESK